MSQQELLKMVVRVLDELHIPYMLTGSIVSSFQGEPRLTHDIDVLIALEKSTIDKLCAAFPPPEFHLDPNSIMRAIESQDMFNLIHISEGDKVDFWILTKEAFDQNRFSRKTAQDIMGMQVFVSSPEDTILMKLRWAKLAGGSEKQFIDALGVYEVQHDLLDLVYLERWARELQLQDYWKRLNDEAEPST